MTTKRSPSEGFMQRAVALSKRGYPAPNPRVGCVIVQDGMIVGQGHHSCAGGQHAEAVALKDAGPRAAGSDVYVTLEPCNHHGRTPPCTAALIEAGVARVVYGCEDPNSIAAGGAARLREAGIEVVGGFQRDKAALANEIWLSAMRLKRPYVVAKAAMSLDGRIALPSGESKWISGGAARRQGHGLRAEMGCVLVGSGTVIADDPLLTTRIPGVKNQPLRVVLDPDGVVSDGASVFSDGAPSLRFVAQGVNRPSAIPLPLVDGRFDLPIVLQELWQRGVTGILVEGGSKTLGAFFEAELVDRLELFVAPKLLGSGLTWLDLPGIGALGSVPTMRLERVRRVGTDLRMTLSRNC